MPNIPRIKRPHTLLEIDWLWDRRTWIMYLTVNGLRQEWKKLVQIRPNDQFYGLLYKHVRAYVQENVEPPDDIAGAILNIADDLMAGRDVTIRAGDYIAIQNHLRNIKQ